jgi:ankyrin repeat protein
MQEELANTLLEHKADVNLTDSDGRTLLHLALARSKHIPVKIYGLFNMIT